MIRWVIETRQFSDETNVVLQSILNTEIWPELVPDIAGTSEQSAKSTQAKIGPYELQDFHLYYITRFGFRLSKVAFLAHHAWGIRSKAIGLIQPIQTFGNPQRPQSRLRRLPLPTRRLARPQ